MFSNLGMGEIFALAIIALVILGPERLPGAITWFFNALRQVREYATGATQQLKDDMGSDFESLREPLQQIQNLRGMTPTAVVTKHLLGGDDSVIREMKEQARQTADSLNLRRIVEESSSAPTPTPTPAATAAPLRVPEVSPGASSGAGAPPRFDPDAT